MSVPTTSVVIDEPPKKSRAWLFVVAAVLVVAAVGVGLFALLGGDDAAAYSLEDAVTRATEAPGVESTMTISALGTDIEVAGTVDNESQLMHMTMELGGGALGVDASIEAVVDQGEGVIYMTSDFFEELGAPVDTPWIRMDRDALESAGQDTGFFDQLDVGNAIDPAALLENAKSVEKGDLEEFEGESVQHYVVTLDAADALADDSFLQSQIGDLGGEMPDEIVYDMWVTEDNELRRVQFALDLGLAKVKTDVVQHLLDEAPAIELPPDDEVTDFTDLL